MLGHREKLKDADELDAVFKAPLCVFVNNSGLRKKVKQRINRRVRRKERQKLKDFPEDIWEDCLT